MKKAWIFLVVLALMAFSLPVFADNMAPSPTVTFSMGPGVWLANIDPTLNNMTRNSGSDRVWPTMDVKMDPNNTFEVGIRMTDNTATLGDNQNLGTNGFGNFFNGASLWHFMWTSDLTGAMGMKGLVDVSVSIGLIDAVLTNWWYLNNGWEWEYGGPSKLPGSNFNTLGAEMTMINGDSNFMGYHLTVGVGPVTFHWVNDFSFENTLVGADFEMSGLGIFVSYGYYGNTYTTYPMVPQATLPSDAPYNANAGQGNFALEAKYDVPQISGWTLKPSAFFRDGIFYSDWVVGVDLSIQYNIAMLNVGFTSTNLYALQHYSAALHILPMGGDANKSPADIWIGAYLDGATPDNAPLQAVDIGASYQFGTFRLIVGYVVGGKDQNNNASGTGNSSLGNVTILNDAMNGRIANGLYFGSFINF